ncbi:MAG TPA: type III secretion system chaperone [Opitutales bacterium]|nr:type III secretion system chaperone [Opitutales bacterium]
MKYGEFLRRFSEETGIDTHSVEGQSGFQLAFTDGSQINFELSEEGHFFDVHLTLIEVPHDNKVAIYEALLAGHLFGIMSGGLSFGLSPEGDRLLIFTRVDLDDCLKEQLRSLVLTFAEVKQDWLSRIAQIMGSEQAAPAVPIPEEHLLRSSLGRV